MYSFLQQEKFFKDLLTTNSSNKQCADCNTVGPTWASLNFGVFLCSNCSGAHRALGPTITRVKSTKLDQWRKQWMDCMMIGNKQLNQYWQSDLKMTKQNLNQIRKPKMGAGQPELIKYASQKYVKRKYVKNSSQQDPLTKYKNGTYVRNQAQCQTKSQQTKIVVKNGGLSVPKIQKHIDVKSNVAVQNEPRNLNLIEFEFPEQPKLQVQSQTSDFNRADLGNNLVAQNLCNPSQTKQKTASHAPLNNDDDDEFSQYTQHGTSFTGTTAQKNVTYEQLFTRKNNGVDSGLIYPPTLQHTHSASLIPHTHYDAPHYSINMNGHNHHVGGHQVIGSTLGLAGIYNQPQNGQNCNLYQSVGYIPGSLQTYNQQEYNKGGYLANNQNQNQNANSLNTNANNLNSQPNNNLSFGRLMSNQNQNQNQQTLNPQSQSLGGYHNQGYGSHQSSHQNKSNSEFHWNDFSGIIKPQYQTPQNQNQNPQNQNQIKSWVDDWK